jgi:hypothetical protein
VGGGEVDVFDDLLRDRERRVSRLVIHGPRRQRPPDFALADPERVHEVRQRHARASAVGGGGADEQQVLAGDRTILGETAQKRLEVEPDVLANALEHRRIAGAIGGDLLLHRADGLVEDLLHARPETIDEQQNAR